MPTYGRQAIAAGLGGFSQGLNGGGNQALEMQQERCRQARDAQRFNAEHRARVAELELEQQRIELERQRLELDRRRAAAEEQTRAESATRGSGEPSGADALLIFGGPDHKIFLGCPADPKEDASFLTTKVSTGAMVSISTSRPRGRRSEFTAAFLATTRPARCSRRTPPSS